MKPVILCVDDDAIVLRSISVIIEESCSGVCQVELAQSGAEAIEVVDQILEHKQDIAMVITDYSMPDMNGDELVRILCEKLPLATMTLMTGYDDADIIARTVNAGRLDRFIGKPWKKDEVVNLVFDVLKLYNLRNELTKKNAELMLASKMARIGLIRVNYLSGLLQLSDEWFDVFGYDKAGIDLDFAFYESLFQEESRKQLAAIRKENLTREGHNNYSVELKMKDADGLWRYVQFCLSAVDFDDQGRPIEFLGVNQDITDQKNRENMLAKAQEKSEILDNLAEQVSFLSLDMKVIWANRSPNGDDAAFIPNETCYKQWYGLDTPCNQCVVKEAIATGKICTCEVLQDGMVHSVIVRPVNDDNGKVMGVIVSKTDITERKHMELRLAHAQQMESIGSLAAGIAHEINTPIQYIGDNITYLDKAFNRIHSAYKKMFDILEKKDLLDRDLQDSLVRVERCFQMAPDAIDDAISGVSHVSRIISAMKDFSHPSVDNYGMVDLNQIVENAITICRNEWKYVARVTTSYQQDRLLIEAVPNSISQVVLNIIINAAHAIDDVFGQDDPSNGKIIIKTSSNEECAILEITDNGSGIDESIQNRIFDPFFTSKEVGKGTGQGLAIAYDIVVEKHKGTIEFESTKGNGTTFIVTLPLANIPSDQQPEQEPDKQLVNN